MTHHVILGAGPAGVIAAETIRKHAPGDTITLKAPDGNVLGTAQTFSCLALLNVMYSAALLCCRR